MMYCSVQDVINVVRIYENDWADQINTIPTELIESFIFEATEEVRTILYLKYELAYIDSLVPTPYAINYVTKLRASYYLLDRIGPVSADRSALLKSLLDNNYDHWFHMIENGLILLADGSGLAVTTKSVRAPIAINPNPNFPGYITDLYTGLPPGQFRRY